MLSSGSSSSRPFDTEVETRRGCCAAYSSGCRDDSLVAVDDRDFGLLQKLRKLPQPTESSEVFAVPDLLSVDIRLTLAALPLLPGRTIPRAPAGALATQVAELGKVASAAPVVSWPRKDAGAGGKGNTDEDGRLVLVGIVQPAKAAASTTSSGSVSLDTAMLSLLGFFLAFLLSDPQLLAGALLVPPAARKFGGDCER